MRILLACLATGCVVGVDAPNEHDSNVRGDGDSIPTNGLIFDVEVAAMLTPDPLGSAVASDGSVTLTSNAAVAELAPGRALLKYIATCALPADHALVVGDVRMPGFYGLATSWETQTCDVTCQHWVSACVLAHANANGTHVSLSLRGDHPNLPQATRPGFTLQESAFYGDLFSRTFYACIGAALATDAAARAVAGRVCGLGECGLVETGECTFFDAQGNPTDYGACTHAAGGDGFFADCHATAAYDDPNPGIHEAVTVYLQP